MLNVDDQTCVHILMKRTDPLFDDLRPLIVFECEWNEAQMFVDGTHRRKERGESNGTLISRGLMGSPRRGSFI